MAYLKHEGYGIKDISDDKPDPEIYQLGLNSRSFGEDHLITPQLPKLPPWAKILWDNVTITPFGRLRDSDLIDNMVVKPYVIGDTKSDNTVGDFTAHSVIAQSLFIRKTLNRDDVVDLGNYDFISYLKNLMAYKAKLAIAANIIDSAGVNAILQEALIPVSEYSRDNELTDDEILGFDGNEIMFVNRDQYKDLMDSVHSNEFVPKAEMAFMYGVKDIVLAPVAKALIFDPSKYYLGFPKGSDGEIVEDFNIDKNTKEILYEIKVCGLLAGNAFEIPMNT